MACHTIGLQYALPVTISLYFTDAEMTYYYCRGTRKPFATLFIVFVIYHHVARKKKSDTDHCTRNVRGCYACLCDITI